MQRPVLRGQLVLDPDRAGRAAERFARPPVRPPLEATKPRGTRLRAPWQPALRAPGAGSWSGRRRGGVGVATWQSRRKAKGRTTEVESATGQLVSPCIPLPITGALPRRAPPGLRPGPATCMAARNAASVAWCTTCWRAGGRDRDRPGWDL